MEILTFMFPVRRDFRLKIIKDLLRLDNIHTKMVYLCCPVSNLGLILILVIYRMIQLGVDMKTSQIKKTQVYIVTVLIAGFVKESLKTH